MDASAPAGAILASSASGLLMTELRKALIREAIDLVDKGVASPEDVDTAYCKGIGLRSLLIGPSLRMHIAGEGIEDFLTNFGDSYRYRWESMETWTSIPSSAFKAVVEGTARMKTVRSKSPDELRKWRDEMLVRVLKTVNGGETASEEPGGCR